jgi:hypothetical protein
MPDELKDKFQQLVADPPPPTAIPSEAVFAKVRTVRRRRTAGVAVLAAAAVIAIAVASNSLTDIDSSPPVSGKPGGATTVIAPTVSSEPGDATTSAIAPPPANTATSSTPPPATLSTQGPPAAPPVGIAVTLTPKLTGRSLTMKVTLKGSLISPLGIDGNGSTELPADTGFLDRSLGTDYTYGDGEQSGSDGGAVTCTGAKKRVASEQTYTLLDGPHVYKKAGTYTFSYTVKYCGAKGQTLQATKTARIVVR